MIILKSAMFGKEKLITKHFFSKPHDISRNENYIKGKNFIFPVMISNVGRWHAKGTLDIPNNTQTSNQEQNNANINDFHKLCYNNGYKSRKNQHKYVALKLTVEITIILTQPITHKWTTICWTKECEYCHLYPDKKNEKNEGMRSLSRSLHVYLFIILLLPKNMLIILFKMKVKGKSSNQMNNDHELYFFYYFLKFSQWLMNLLCVFQDPFSYLTFLLQISAFERFSFQYLISLSCQMNSMFILLLKLNDLMVLFIAKVFN